MTDQPREVTTTNYMDIIRDVITASGSEILEAAEPVMWLGNPHLVFQVVPENHRLPRVKCIELVKALGRLRIDTAIDADAIPGRPVRGYIVNVYRVNGEKVKC